MKLTFPLCAKCSDKRQNRTCDHGDEDRSIMGAWIHLELRKAMEKGYRILEVYEHWMYQMVKLNPTPQEQKDDYVIKQGLFERSSFNFSKILQDPGS